MLRSSVPAAGEFSVVTFDVLPEGLVDQILDVFVCVYLHVGELLAEPLPQLDGRPHQLVVGSPMRSRFVSSSSERGLFPSGSDLWHDKNLYNGLPGLQAFVLLGRILLLWIVEACRYTATILAKYS